MQALSKGVEHLLEMMVFCLLFYDHKIEKSKLLQKSEYSLPKEVGVR
jgi:hypothetical protein